MTEEAQDDVIHTFSVREPDDYITPSLFYFIRPFYHEEKFKSIHFYFGHSVRYSFIKA